MGKGFLVVLGKKKSGVKKLAREVLRALLIRVTLGWLASVAG